jgi:tRNA threonylcarbamoyladenosine biosynthesis protein TsaE
MMTFALTELSVVAAKVIACVTELKLAGVSLTGDLGAGKTTLAQEIGRQLGVQDVITSPTFVLLKSYPATNDRYNLFVHVDAYRIEGESEAKTIHLERYLAGRSFFCIEWPERMHGSLPQQLLPLSLRAVDDTHREIEGI